jgi:hypothetical protein
MFCRRPLPFAALCLLGMAAGCTGSGGIADEDLGGLVHAESHEPPPIDVARAGKEVDELTRALTMPHRRVGAALGPHRFAGTSRADTTEGTSAVDAVDVTTAIELDADGSFHAKLDNQREYGREAFYVAKSGLLYLRPRYGKFHRRPPVDADEAAGIRDQIFGDLGAYFELLAPGVEISDKGATKAAGRDARRIEIKLAPKQRPLPAPAEHHKQWRQDVTVTAATGEVLLDAATGVPLEGHLEGTAAFGRDGRNFAIHLAVTHTISGIGQAQPITAPADADSVATPDRLREVEERDSLLRGIAPPTKRGGAVPPVTGGEPAPGPSGASDKPGPSRPGTSAGADKAAPSGGPDKKAE